MNQRPYYRQSAVVFCMLSVIFLVIGLSLALHNDKILLLEVPLFAGIILYAIASTIQINKRAKRQPDFGFQTEKESDSNR